MLRASVRGLHLRHCRFALRGPLSGTVAPGPPRHPWPGTHGTRGLACGPRQDLGRLRAKAPAVDWGRCPAAPFAVGAARARGRSLPRSTGDAPARGPLRLRHPRRDVAVQGGRHLQSLPVGGAADGGLRGEPAGPQQPVAKVPAAFERRCIPPDCVAPRSNMPNILPRPALSGGRLAALGATRGFTTGCQGPVTGALWDPRPSSARDRSLADLGRGGAPRAWATATGDHRPAGFSTSRRPVDFGHAASSSTGSRIGNRAVTVRAWWGTRRRCRPQTGPATTTGRPTSRSGSGSGSPLTVTAASFSWISAATS